MSSSLPKDVDPATLEPFLGLWVDRVGRAVLVRRLTPDGNVVVVSVTASVSGPPYKQKGLAFTFETIDLEARVKGDGDLEVEAGSDHLGPTYRLTLDNGASGGGGGGGGEEPGLLPSVHIGLYDDYDDDLGVPWAYPLERYRRARQEECDKWNEANPTMIAHCQ